MGYYHECVVHHSEVAFGGRYPLSLPYGARTFLMYGFSALHTRLSDPVAELIVHELGGFVKYLANFPGKGYTIGINIQRVWIGVFP